LNIHEQEFTFKESSAAILDPITRDSDTTVHTLILFPMEKLIKTMKLMDLVERFLNNVTMICHCKR